MESSNKLQKVHAIKKIIPSIEEKIAKIYFPKKRFPMAIVISVNEKSKNKLGGILFKKFIIYLIKKIFVNGFIQAGWKNKYIMRKKSKAPKIP